MIIMDVSVFPIAQQLYIVHKVLLEPIRIIVKMTKSKTNVTKSIM